MPIPEAGDLRAKQEQERIRRENAGRQARETAAAEELVSRVRWCYEEGETLVSEAIREAHAKDRTAVAVWATDLLDWFPSYRRKLRDKGYRIRKVTASYDPVHDAGYLCCVTHDFWVILWGNASEDDYETEHACGRALNEHGAVQCKDITRNVSDNDSEPEYPGPLRKAHKAGCTSVLAVMVAVAAALVGFLLR